MDSASATATPKASVHASATSARRTATPPPRAKADSQKKPSEKVAEVAKEPAKEEQKVEPTADTETQIFGLHPQAFTVLVVVILIVFALCAIAMEVLGNTHGPIRKYLATAIAKVTTQWNTVSAPVEKFVLKYADVMVAVVAVGGFSPIIVIVAVTSFRASMDLHLLPMWQKVSLAALVLTALATVFTSMDRLHFPVTKEDYIAATVVLTCVPLALAAIAYVLRAVFTCERWFLATDAFRAKPAVKEGDETQ